MSNWRRRWRVPGACALLAACVLVQCKKVPPCQATVTLANQSARGEGPDKVKAFGQACVAFVSNTIGWWTASIAFGALQVGRARVSGLTTFSRYPSSSVTSTPAPSAAPRKRKTCATSIVPPVEAPELEAERAE